MHHLLPLQRIRQVKVRRFLVSRFPALFTLERSGDRPLALRVSNRRFRAEATHEKRGRSSYAEWQ